ncbi:MAG: CatB-related O-acetyltransferase [Salegentibacter mishustinae]|nr:CatB-related O-acetyltransferase [Salegentibacter mishustinae]
MNLIKYIFSRKYRKRVQFDREIKNKFPQTNIRFKNTISPELIELGKHSYGEPKVDTLGLQGEKLKIGCFVSIADNVTFILSGGHHTDTFTTFPLKTICLNEKEPEALCKGPIIIEDDVWIGYGVTVLSGIKIGKGAIVAAGAVVTSSLEPYGIYGGVPAKLIKYRFSKSIINELITIDMSHLSIEDIRKNKDIFYASINEETLKNIMTSLKTI